MARVMEISCQIAGAPDSEEDKIGIVAVNKERCFIVGHTHPCGFEIQIPYEYKT